MPLYETVFIARQDLAAEDIDTLTDNLAKIVTNGGGKVVFREYWGARNLAYKVKKNTRGHYIFLSLDSEYAAVAELNRVMGLSPHDPSRGTDQEQSCRIAKEVCFPRNRDPSSSRGEPGQGRI